MTAATSAAEFERHRDHLTGVAYRMLDTLSSRTATAAPTAVAALILKSATRATRSEPQGPIRPEPAGAHMP
jgi:hypothetical protein